MEESIGPVTKLIRNSLKLTKVELSLLVKINEKTVRKLEFGKKCSIKSVVKIRNALKENYNLDLYEISGIRYVWYIKDFTRKCLDIVEGSLLGDASVSKGGVFVQTSKDKNYLNWLAKILSEEGLKCKVIKTKSKSSFSNSDSYWLYSHSCPALLTLRNRWYVMNNGRGFKIVPPNIKITSDTLLHWYLGDGNLKRDNRSKKMGRPYVRLYTNDFNVEDIRILLGGLRKIKLNFNTVPKLSYGKEKGFVLYLHPDSLLNFFMLVGIKPPEEIEHCVTEIRKGKIIRFNSKWPLEEDWNRILPKDKNVGMFIKQKRLEDKLTLKEFSNKIGLGRKRTIADYEHNRKHMSTLRFEKMLKVFNMNTKDVLKYVLFAKETNLASKNYKEGMLATDLIENIPKVI